MSPIVTPDLYLSMMVLFIATYCARMVVRSWQRSRRPRVPAAIRVRK